MLNKRLGVFLVMIATSAVSSTSGQVSAPVQSGKQYDYARVWPAGRGFDVGDTVPDIPLVDLEGNEVRFSRFLGKRYVLYCWASW